MLIAGNRMIDCAQGLAELTPYEGYRCLIDSLDWPTLAHHAEQTWSTVTTSAFGQWTAIVGTIVVIVPTIVLSWLLSFSFIAGLYGLARNPAIPSPAPADFASWNQPPTVLYRQAAALKTRCALSCHCTTAFACRRCTNALGQVR